MNDIENQAGSRDLGATSVRRRGAAVAFATFCLVFLALAPAARADCPITDLTCTIDAVEDVVDDTADEVVQTTTDTVETVTGETPEVIDPIVETVEETVETVEETVGGAEETVEQIVDEAVGAAEETIDDTVAAVEETVDGTVGPVLEEPVVLDESNTGPSHGGTESGGSVSESGAVVLSLPVGVLSSPDPSTEGAVLAAFNVAARGLTDDVGSGFLTVAKTLAFPIALALVVGAFLMVQNRLDRRDPKLALAPVGPDVVGFA